jgi:hypothetical protein
MKQIIAIIAFFTITLLSTTNSVAQENSSRSTNNEAKAFTHQLVQEFKINTKQQHVLNAAYMYKVRQTNAVKTNIKDKNEAKAKIIAINEEFDTKLKSVLTEVQYKKFKLSKK